MKALTLEGKAQIGYTSVIDPEIKKSQDVIIEVKATAICGSDLHVYHEREFGFDYGMVMGHEFVGEIVEVGKDVRAWKKGDMVMTPFTTSCGVCYFCQQGLTCRCIHGQLYGWVEKGEGLQGGQAEYVRVPLADTTLLSVPEGVELEEGLLLGDILATGYFCADRVDIFPEGTYVVIGCGPVGLMSIIGAREQGAEKIYALDSVPERLAQAEKWGAIALDYTQENISEIIADATEGRGADGVMEVVGNPAAMSTAWSLVRPGGVISSVGVHTSPHFSFSPAQAYDKNLTYRAGRCPARHYMPKLLPLVQEKKYDLTSVFSHRLSLAEGAKGYQIFDQKCDHCTKVVLYP